MWLLQKDVMTKVALIYSIHVNCITRKQSNIYAPVPVETNELRLMVTTGHSLPGPGTYRSDANAFGSDMVISDKKYLRLRPISKNSFPTVEKQDIPALPKNYKSQYSFPKKMPIDQLKRGKVMISTVQNIPQQYKAGGSTFRV